ncbi:(Fe-S)-binding protein [Chloroflexota bacterium]
MQEIDRDVTDIVNDQGGEILKLCYQCGTCTSTCPWNTVRNFLIRRTMHKAQFGLLDFEDEDMWLCVTCKACVARCPRGVEIIDVWRALRRVIVEVGAGKVPDSLRVVVKNIASVGNPQGEERGKWIDWAKGAGIKPFTKEAESLYLPCCYTIYDPQFERVVQATLSILQKSNVEFGFLDAELSCCGESVRKTGNESLFQSLAQTNIGALNEASVTNIIAASPHCYDTINKEYPDLGANFEVKHFSVYLAELIKEGRLKLTKEVNKKVTYHDSCYLGRHNEIYDEPRQVLESIPGLELVEMRDSRNNSLCCGGGGGGIWEETKKEERFADLRVEQALEVGAEILAVACPYCMVMLGDSILASNKGDAIEVKDIAELVQEAI